MREDLIFSSLPGHGEAIDPVAMARKDLSRKLPARFFKEATIEPTGEGFGLLLDGKTARTPGRNILSLPGRRAAMALAAEWNGLTDVIDPNVMPVTRLANSALDGVASQMAATRTEIVRYAGSDLLCYRAGEPESLVAAQAAAWDPALERARSEIGARFILSQGVMFVEQPENSIQAVARAVAAFTAPTRLAALSSMTSLTGSVLLSLGVAYGWFTASEAWAAAHVDEDFQMRSWGADEEALARRARRWREMEAAALMLMGE